MNESTATIAFLSGALVGGGIFLLIGFFMGVDMLPDRPGSSGSLRDSLKGLSGRLIACLVVGLGVLLLTRWIVLAVAAGLLVIVWPLLFGGAKQEKLAAAKIEAGKLYTPKQAMELVKELSSAKFDETVEVSVRLGVDTRKADQNVRGSISLPNGTGKAVRVAVFAEGEKAREAEAAGADIVGSDDLVAEITAGNLNFDAVIATPNLMGKVGRLGRVLGPRGLMPNPKLGTVTMDVEKMVKELKAGRVEYRADRYGICHVPMGKASFDVKALVENYAALITELLRVKPSSAKGKYVKSVVISSTMGPGIKVDSTKVRNFMED